jgi:hypothetical protein
MYFSDFFFVVDYCLSFYCYQVDIFLFTFTEWNGWFVYKERMNAMLDLVI